VPETFDEILNLAQGALDALGLSREEAVAAGVALWALFATARYGFKAARGAARLAVAGLRGAAGLFRGPGDPLLAAVDLALEDDGATWNQRHQQLLSGGLLADVSGTEYGGRAHALNFLRADFGQGEDVLTGLTRRERRAVLAAVNRAIARARYGSRLAARARVLDGMGFTPEREDV
jgi:hypothetical protein